MSPYVIQLVLELRVKSSSCLSCTNAGLEIHATVPILVALHGHLSEHAVSPLSRLRG